MSDIIKPHILLVEDEGDLQEILQDALVRENWQVTIASSLEVAQKLLQAEGLFDLILSDIKLKTQSGLELLKEDWIKKRMIPVILMTAFGTIPEAVSAIQKGAREYLIKPFGLDELKNAIKKYLYPKCQDNIVAIDRKSQELFATAFRVAQTDITVLLLGESGTGKEVLAQYIHKYSKRKDKPFKAINCAAIPDTMLESILFGHEKGSFTGATHSTSGKFEQAQGGTLLLDEISEMPLQLQAKLLRVLQEKVVERIGSKEEIELDVRIIATTNRDLYQYVQEGKFREDLYYRLNVFPLETIPLRKRSIDIPKLAESFLISLGKNPSILSQAALGLLMQHSWPGNIRELYNVLSRATILATDYIAPEHLRFDSVTAENVTYPEEQEHILQVLKQTGGKRKEAAVLLGISERTLRYKLAKLRTLGVFKGAENGKN